MTHNYIRQSTNLFHSLTVVLFLLCAAYELPPQCDVSLPGLWVDPDVRTVYRRHELMVRERVLICRTREHLATDTAILLLSFFSFSRSV